LNWIELIFDVRAGGITSESLTGDTKLVVEEITRCLNLEKLLPCYKMKVTVACLGAIRKLQKFGHIPSSPAIFRSYSGYGQCIGKTKQTDVY
jgi:transcription initiation factor TFIID subunit 2